MLHDILKPYMADGEPDREQFVVCFMDAKNRIIAMETMFVGTLTASQVYPREIIKKILSHRAAAIVIAHNHPSGDAQPSAEDCAITKLICAACIAIGATLHEHIIIGETGKYYSFADEGYIATYKNRIREIF